MLAGCGSITSALPSVSTKAWRLRPLICRVDEGSGDALECAPFPFPAHQTGRADFPHPAFRPDSSQSNRRRYLAPTPKTPHSQFVVDMVLRESAHTASLRLVSSAQEAHLMIVDVPINGFMG